MILIFLGSWRAVSGVIREAVIAAALTGLMIRRDHRVGSSAKL
jgi:hypothetical protein